MLILTVISQIVYPGKQKYVSMKMALVLLSPVTETRHNYENNNLQIMDCIYSHGALCFSMNAQKRPVLETHGVVSYLVN